MPSATSTLAPPAAATQIVSDHVALAMLASLIPVPMTEFAAVSAVHLTMVEHLAEVYKVDFKPHHARAIIASLLTAYTSTVLGRLALGSLAKLVPGLGSVVSLVTLPSIAGALTYAMGQVFIRHFESGGTFLTLNSFATQAHFLREVESRQASVA
jgi:uncharacterized protein (DUF697 family)